MADATRARIENTPGDFFVDETCIDCATCRWVAPATFDRAGDRSRVHRQPHDGGETERALKALVACPTSSIGTRGKHDLKPVLAGLPEPVDGPVHYCGFASEDSFGAAAWLVRRRQGNVMVDVPRFAAPLVKNVEAMGGVAMLFLTHKDDVAEHDRWAAHFGCERVLHERDVTRGTRDVERVLQGDAAVELGPGLLAIPTPGHTEGSTCLLVDERWLFSGDHLAKNPRDGELYAFRSACWFDWEVQTRSMERLLEHPFEWVLPGHGHPFHASRDAARASLERCIRWMAAPVNEGW